MVVARGKVLNTVGLQPNSASTISLSVAWATFYFSINRCDRFVVVTK